MAKVPSIPRPFSRRYEDHVLFLDTKHFSSMSPGRGTGTGGEDGSWDMGIRRDVRGFLQDLLGCGDVSTREAYLSSMAFLSTGLVPFRKRPC